MLRVSCCTFVFLLEKHPEFDVAQRVSKYPAAQNQYMQKKILREFILNLCEYMRGLHSHSREYRKIVFAAF